MTYYSVFTTAAERKARAAHKAAHPISTRYPSRKVTGMEMFIPGVSDVIANEIEGIRFRIIDTKYGHIVVHRPSVGPEDMDWTAAPAPFPSSNAALRYLDEIAVAAR